MELRTLLVHADTDERLPQRLALSISIAREHQARLLVLYVLKAPMSLSLYGEPMGAPAADLIQQEMSAEQGRAEDLRRSVEKQLGGAGTQWEWRSVQGVTSERVAATGTSADLIVVGQPQESVAAIAQVALSAGRPVLCVPHTGNFATVGRRVLVAWHGTRESARALHDALPFLVRADHVTLFTAGDGTEDDVRIDDALRQLISHDVKAELRRATLKDVDAGTAILNAVTESASDLLVMGAYGHSRLRELVFGGATRTVLRSMPVPTLISH